MDKLKESIGFISSVLGIVSFFYSIFCLQDIKSNITPFVMGIIITLICVVIFVRVKSLPKYTEIDGIRIEEADNIPLFVPKKNKLNPINISHLCEIFKNDAILEYDYYGICCDKNGCDKFSTYCYSHDISELNRENYYAYDIKNDPMRSKKLLPKLDTPKGAASKMNFNFLYRIKYNTVFHYFTHQFVKNSVLETGKDHYVSCVLYKNRPIDTYKVILKFHDINPKQINVYSIKNRKGTFQYQLSEYTNDNNTYTYIDNIKDGNAWSVRVYIFDREKEDHSI